MPGTRRTPPTPPGDDDHLDSLHLSQTLNGRWRLDADLNKLTGEKLATALDSVATPQTGHPDETGDYAPRTPEQQRADQLDEFLTRALAADILPTKGGLTPRVTLTGDIAAFLGRPDLIDTLLQAHNTPPDLYTHNPHNPDAPQVPDALRSSTARLERIVAAMNAYLHSSPTLARSGIISDEVAAMVACDAKITPHHHRRRQTRLPGPRLPHRQPHAAPLPQHPRSRLHISGLPTTPVLVPGPPPTGVG